MIDYLHLLSNQENAKKIVELRAEKASLRLDPKLDLYRRATESAPQISTNYFDFSSEKVTIGKPDELSPADKEVLFESLKIFIPWKKGPFSIFGIDIDSEWRSDLKWDRIIPHKKSLNGKVVADIGCHNGYYMYRMLSENPQMVVGFEPFAKHLLAFELIQKYARSEQLFFELLGVEHIDLFEQFFDSVFCLGILYHHANPIDILRKIRSSLKPGGELIVDCQGIFGSESIALMPKTRYAGAKGVWWVPTESCLVNWLNRAMFREIQVFYSDKLSPEEQRTTEWAPIHSLSSFLNPQDQNLTIENYPAPWRFYVKAIR
jgi:tRNA (mo5U34)-methyltransferase